MPESLKSLKLWQVLVLAVFLVGGPWAGYQAYVLASGTTEESLSANQHLILVQKDNLVNQVSTNGSLIFPNKETVAVGTGGIVGDVLVNEGQIVEEGQPLVLLDDATVASLHKEVAKERINLRDAQEALDSITNGSTSEEIEIAQSTIDLANSDLDNALRDLKLAEKEWVSKLQSAQDARDEAIDGYFGVLTKWLGMGVPLEQTDLDMDPATLLDSHGIDLTSIFGSDLRYRDISAGSSAGEVPQDDPSTAWDERIVYAWLNLYPGQLDVSCDDGVAPFHGACIQGEIDLAWDVYEDATDNLDTVESQMATAISKAESGVNRAEDSLAASQEAIADLNQDPDPLVLALRQAELTSAQSALETALSQLEGATIRSPMSGSVSVINVEEGQAVNANTPAVEIVDQTVVEVDGVVDEIDVLFIRHGAQATVTLDALPGQILEGTVSEIGSAARNQQGVVTYPIRILLQVPVEVEIREGLSATANIVLREERDVLLVPIQVLYGTFDQPLVRVMNNGQIEERAVVLGNSDDFWVVVSQGLTEGDQVVMETTQAATTGFGLGLRGGFPGGGGGGRGQGPAR